MCKPLTSRVKNKLMQREALAEKRSSLKPLKRFFLPLGTSATSAATFRLQVFDGLPLLPFP